MRSSSVCFVRHMNPNRIDLAQMPDTFAGSSKPFEEDCEDTSIYSCVLSPTSMRIRDNQGPEVLGHTVGEDHPQI